MLNEILNLEGVAVLSKEQQKSVNGGAYWGTFSGSACRLRITEGGKTYTFTQYFTSSTNSGISEAANNACVENIAGGATRCTYDCSYDGYGQ